MISAGVKVAADASDRLSLSVVPEILVSTIEPTFGVRLSSNIVLSGDGMGLWLTGQGAWQGVPEVRMGGGGWVDVSGGGLYVNGWRNLVRWQGGNFSLVPSTVVGLGGWWGLSDTSQLDLGVDVLLIDGDGLSAVLPQVGLSVAF